MTSGARRSTDSPCPFAECVGDGWILGEDNFARRSRRWIGGSPWPGPGPRPRHPSAVLERRFRARVRGEHEPRGRRRHRSLLPPPRQEPRGRRGHVVLGPERVRQAHALAMLISQRPLAAEHAGAIYNLPDLLASIRYTYSDDREQHYGQLMRGLTSVDLLHLEDMTVGEDPTPGCCSSSTPSCQPLRGQALDRLYRGRRRHRRLEQARPAHRLSDLLAPLRHVRPSGANVRRRQPRRARPLIGADRGLNVGRARAVQLCGPPTAPRAGRDWLARGAVTSPGDHEGMPSGPLRTVGSCP